MTVTVEIPAVLRPRCGGDSQLSVIADNVQSVLDQIEQMYPDLHYSICNETGAVRRHINVFVNSSLVCRSRESVTRVRSGDTVFIFQAVSGG